MSKAETENLVQVGRDVGSVIQALQILRELAESDSPKKASALAKATGISPSSTLNLLRTLANERLIGFAPEAKEYWLDLGILELARPLLNQSRVELIRPHLMAIAIKYGSLISVWRPVRDTRLLLVDRIAPEVTVRVEMRIAASLPVGAGAVGRAVLSALQIDNDGIREMFEQIRWAAPIDFASYLAQLEETRANGFAIDSGTLVKGVAMVASCIRGFDGSPLLGISAANLVGQNDHTEQQRLGRELHELACEARSAFFGTAG